jgi:hypothetical protein
MNYIVKKKEKAEAVRPAVRIFAGCTQIAEYNVLAIQKVSSASGLNKRVISPMRLWAVPQRQGMGAGLI